MYSKESMASFVNSITADCDICLINNQSLEDETIGMLLMSIADHNLFILDSRKTAEKKITKLELLRNEFSIPDLWFVLNKADYNPSIFKQGYKCISVLIKKWKKK